MNDETGLRPLDAGQWDGSLSRVLADMRGRPLNVHCLMANHPRLLKAWWDFRQYSVTGGDLDQRQCELVILRVATHMRAWYEWASHVVRAIDAGLTLEEIEHVKSGPAHTAWSAPESLLLQAVDQCVERRQITPATLRELRTHFSDRQVLDIIAIHGMYVTLGVMINTWGLELDAHVVLPATVTRERWNEESRR